MVTMSKEVEPSSVPALAMSVENVCHEDNISSKEYVHSSDNIDTDDHTKCQTHVTGEDKRQLQKPNECNENIVNKTCDPNVVEKIILFPEQPTFLPKDAMQFNIEAPEFVPIETGELETKDNDIEKIEFINLIKDNEKETSKNSGDGDIMYNEIRNENCNTNDCKQINANNNCIGIELLNLSPTSFIPYSPELFNLLKKQISYYFSTENLNKDEYLRFFMDRRGYVPVTLIASFKRIKSLSRDIQFIICVISTMEELELNENKVRCRNNPRKWPIMKISQKYFLKTDSSEFAGEPREHFPLISEFLMVPKLPILSFSEKVRYFLPTYYLDDIQEEETAISCETSKKTTGQRSKLSVMPSGYFSTVNNEKNWPTINFKQDKKIKAQICTGEVNPATKLCQKMDDTEVHNPLNKNTLENRTAFDHSTEFKNKKATHTKKKWIPLHI